MGIRVRKLARELRQSPRDVLQLLKSLGFERYQSPEDMISDTVAARIRSSSRKPSNGHAPDPARTLHRPSVPPPPSPPGDLMAQLVPGVKRTRPDQRAQSNVRAAEESALQAKRAEIARAEEALGAERDALAVARSELDAREVRAWEESARLEALADALAAREAALAASVEAFESARRASLTEPEPSGRGGTAPASTANIVSVLRERGIRGLDEAQRALGALAFGHALGPFLKDLAVADEEGFRRLIADKLVLVGGEIPGALTVPAVSVSPDRADLPGADVLAHVADKLAEQWLLAGFRSVTLAGVPPRWHPVLRALIDKRVALSFAPPSTPPSRLGPSEAWFAWGPPMSDETVERAYWIPADGSLVLWLQRVTAVVADGS